MVAQTLIGRCLLPDLGGNVRTYARNGMRAVFYVHPSGSLLGSALCPCSIPAAARKGSVKNQPRSA